MTWTTENTLKNTARLNRKNLSATFAGGAESRNASTTARQTSATTSTSKQSPLRRVYKKSYKGQRMSKRSYETKIDKAEKLEQAAIRAESPTIKACWICKAQMLRAEAEEMTIEEASK